MSDQKQVNNMELVKEYLAETDSKITEQTKKTYTNISKNLDFNILTKQALIVKKLKDADRNPNTTAIYLNIVILVRRHRNEGTDKLIKYRNSLRDEIIKLRKENLKKVKDDLPTYQELEESLDKMSGLSYVINYLFLKYGVRNKDLNLLHVTKLPDKQDENENYLMHNKRRTSLIINDYKTDGNYGTKKIEISDKRFNKELKDMKLQDGSYLMPKKNGDKMKLSTFNEKIKSLSLKNLGEAKIFKVVIAHLIDKRDYNKIEALSATRGTSLSTVLKSYNVYNTE